MAKPRGYVSDLTIDKYMKIFNGITHDNSRNMTEVARSQNASTAALRAAVKLSYIYKASNGSIKPIATSYTKRDIRKIMQYANKHNAEISRIRTGGMATTKIEPEKPYSKWRGFVGAFFALFK